MSILHPWIDLTHSPFVWIRCPRSGDVHNGVELISEFYAAWHRYLLGVTGLIGVLTDTSQMETWPNAKVRAAWAAGEQLTQTLEARVSVGNAYVEPSAIGRGVLTAVYWVSPPPYPYKIFSTHAEATTWLICQMQARTAAAYNSRRAEVHHA